MHAGNRTFSLVLTVLAVASIFGAAFSGLYFGNYKAAVGLSLFVPVAAILAMVLRKLAWMSLKRQLLRSLDSSSKELADSYLIAHFMRRSDVEEFIEGSVDETSDASQATIANPSLEAEIPEEVANKRAG